MNQTKLFCGLLLCGAMILAGCNKKGASSEAAADSTRVAGVSEGLIAYVNIDSLVSNYAMYYDLKSQFEEKQKKVEAELTSKGRSLERDMMKYQEQVQKGLVTRMQAASIEQDLQKKEQNFMQYRSKVLGELDEEQQVILNKIHYSIVEYLKEFNSDHRFKVILSTTAGGPILNADPTLDITKEVAVGLNDSYKKTTAKNPTTQP